MTPAIATALASIRTSSGRRRCVPAILCAEADSVLTTGTTCARRCFDLLQRPQRFRPERGDWHGFVRGIMRNRSAALAVEREKHSLRFAGETATAPPATTRMASIP